MFGKFYRDANYFNNIRELYKILLYQYKILRWHIEILKKKHYILLPSTPTTLLMNIKPSI